MKKLKIFGVLCTIALMFFVGTSSVSADESGTCMTLEDAPSNFFALKSNDYKASDYPYHVVTVFCGYSGFGYVQDQYWTAYSKSPIIKDGDSYINSDGSDMLISSLVHQYKSSGNPQHTFSNYGVGSITKRFSHNDRVFFTANATIKNKDGTDFFTVPLLTEKVVQPLAEGAKKNSLVIVGSTICLVALGACLMVLPRVLRKYTNS